MHAVYIPVPDEAHLGWNRGRAVMAVPSVVTYPVETTVETYTPGWNWITVVIMIPGQPVEDLKYDCISS